MVKKHEEAIIGYSGFIFFEDCYQYNENACYIASSKDLAKQFMKDCGYTKSDFRIDEISMGKLINDYGCSSGEYAMEEITFEKFIKIAGEIELKYTYEDYEMMPELKVVSL